MKSNQKHNHIAVEVGRGSSLAIVPTPERPVKKGRWSGFDKRRKSPCRVCVHRGAQIEGECSVAKDDTFSCCCSGASESVPKNCINNN